METNEVLDYLGTALAGIDGDFVKRNRVSRLRDSPIGLVMSELSLMERETMDTSSIRLIAMAKQVLTGRQTAEAFVAKCNEVNGL